MTSLRTVTAVQGQAFMLMLAAVEENDAKLAADWAQVVRACASVRIAGMPARSIAHFGTDPLELDTGDPPESEAEYVAREVREARG